MPDIPPNSTSRFPRRRKLRRGTRSCWQCKRRKIRCTFAAPTDTVCDGCRSRHTSCIGQEFDDEDARKSSDVDKLDQAEASAAEPNRQQTKSRGNGSSSGFDSGPAAVETAINQQLHDQVNPDHHDLVNVLLETWPSPSDFDLILSAPLSNSGLFHGLICQPYSKFLSTQIRSPQQMLQLPPPTSHPVLIARKLLQLASLLQSIRSHQIAKNGDWAFDYHALMTRVFNTATRLVTSNDDLINSVEGIECIMMESMYLNNAGNLRRAWLTNRRAMVTAQMLGLHTGTSSLSTFIDIETANRIKPDYMWFRIVCSDRYLSLVLGLPQGCLEDTLVKVDVLDEYNPLERMERLETVAAGLILQRNQTQRVDLDVTYKVDKMLQEAAALMPPAWWVMSYDLGAVGNEVDAFEESIRLMQHFAFHNLLIQLHLPNMMLASSLLARHDYSRMTAVNSSRAILTQFVSFRSSCLSAAYCRGVDFITFIASTALCVAHIGAREHHSNDGSNGLTALQSIRHLRLGDRGLLERTLNLMTTMAQINDDAVGHEISAILQPLLEIENAAFHGTQYHVSAHTEGLSQGSKSSRNSRNTVSTLCIKIPYFGTIRFEPNTSHFEDRSNQMPQLRAEDTTLSSSPSQPTLNDNLGALCSNEGLEATPNIRGAGYEISTNYPANVDWDAVPSCLTDPLLDMNSTDCNRQSSDASATNMTYLLVPGLAADLGDWPLQGVDLALFNNFVEGATDTTTLAE